MPKPETRSWPENTRLDDPGIGRYPVDAEESEREGKAVTKTIELWTIVHAKGQMFEGKAVFTSDYKEMPGYIVLTSRKDAEIACKDHLEIFGLECEPKLLREVLGARLK